MVCLLEGPELRCTFANPLYAKLYGNRELIGKTPQEMVPDLEGQGHFEVLENVYKTGTPFYGFNHPVSADWLNEGSASTKYFNFVYFPYKVEEQTIGVIAFGLEVTDYVVARKAADDHQLLLHTLSSASPLAFGFVMKRWIASLSMKHGSGGRANLWNTIWGLVGLTIFFEEDREYAFHMFKNAYDH
jgi:hypothetical protein